MSEGARNYGGVSAADRSAVRRARLVDATVAVLAGGESRTTMTAICAQAGLTERYFYESFASRDDALVAALDAVSDEIAATAVRAVADASGDPAARVRAAIAAFVGLVVAEPDKGRVAVIESTANPALRARRHLLLGGFADLMAREAAALYGDRAWPPDRARVHGLVFVAGFAELVASWLTDEGELTADELIAMASDLFVAVASRH